MRKKRRRRKKRKKRKKKKKKKRRKKKKKKRQKKKKKKEEEKEKEETKEEETKEEEKKEEEKKKEEESKEKEKVKEEEESKKEKEEKIKENESTKENEMKKEEESFNQNEIEKEKVKVIENDNEQINNFQYNGDDLSNVILYSSNNKKYNFINNFRKLEINEKLEAEKENIENKLVYTFSLDKKIKKVELNIKANNDKILSQNPSCLIKYQLDNYQNYKYKFQKEIKVSKKGNGIDVSFNSLESKDSNDIKENLKITYTIYLCKKITNIDNIHPNFIEESNIIEKKNIEKTGNEIDLLNLEFNIKKNQEYTIIVLATVKSEEYEEYFIYQAFNYVEKGRPNDILFFVIMGSFAFVIIIVFSLIFCIINKRKANNPDIDDEEYSNLHVLRETINEDEN